MSIDLTPRTDTPPVPLDRAGLWQLVADAVAAGCPVPLNIYLNDLDGADAFIGVQVNHPADVDPWSRFLHLGTPTVRVYPVDGGRMHRVTEVSSRVPRIEVRHIHSFDPTGTTPTGGGQ